MLPGRAVDLARVTHVSRPLIGVLVATVLLFAVYTVALKPSSSGGGGGSPGSYKSAVDKARQVQGVVNGAGARDGGTPSGTPTTPAPTTSAPPTTSTTTTSQSPPTTSSGPTTTTPGSATPAAPTIASLASATGVIGSIKPASSTLTAADRFRTVQVGLKHHKVLALLFYNPASSDDRAVAAELSAIPTHGGAVVKLSIPVQQMSAYSSLLSQVP